MNFSINLGRTIVNHFESSPQNMRISQNFFPSIVNFMKSSPEKANKNTFDSTFIATKNESSHFVFVELKTIMRKSKALGKPLFHD